MNDQWQELKETIIELRDNDGTGTQQEVCKFLVNYMDILEKQMQEPCGGVISRQPEIILCGQCKYAEAADPEDSQDGYTCQFHRGSIWFSGSYCSWAERRQDG